MFSEEQLIGFIKDNLQISTAVITFILNLLVTIGLIRREKGQFELRRSNERQYQSELFLYQHLIIKEVGNYVDCANKIEAHFVELCEALVTNPRNKRKIIEKTQDDVDQIDRTFRSDVISKTNVFSSEFAKITGTLWNDFYDASTVVITKLDRLSVTQEVCHKHRSEMSLLKETFLSETFKVIKRYHPKLK